MISRSLLLAGCDFLLTVSKHHLSMATRCLAKYSTHFGLSRCSVLMSVYSIGRVWLFPRYIHQFDGAPSQGLLGVMHLLIRHGFPKISVHSFIQRNSFLLTSRLSDVGECLDYVLSFHLSRTSLVSFLNSCPQLLDTEFLDKWRPLLGEVMRSNIPVHVFLKLVQESEKLQIGEVSNLSIILQILYNVATTDETVIRVLDEFPRVLALKHFLLSDRIELLKQIGFKRNEIDQMLSLFPGVLGLSVEGRLKPLFQEFWDLRFHEKEVKKAIVNDPKLLAAELGEFSQCSEFLQTLRCRHPIRKEIMLKGTLRAAIDVKLRVDFLWRYGLNRRDAFKMLQREPRIILYELLDLNKKIDFLLQRFRFDISSLIDVPEYLGVNMEKTIVPRYEVIEHLKLIGGLGRELGLKEIIRPSKLKFYNLYVKPYPQCENIFGKQSRIVEFKPKHPPGLWRMFKPLPYPETKEDIMNIRAFMENLSPV